MLFAGRVPIPAMVAWCRALRHGVDIGLSPVKIFRQQAKGGPPAARGLAATIADRLADGDSIADALQPDRGKFPRLFVELVGVGERSGRLTEAFIELERYFETIIAGRRQLAAALVWPIMMYVSAVFVIAAMLFILGLLAPAGGKGFDPLGLGLLGPAGALTFLVVMFVVTAVVVATFFYVRDNEPLRAKVEAALVPVPVLGDCFRAFALQRFAMALHMTVEAGMRADACLAYSLRATANGRYTAKAEEAARAAKGGDEVGEILERLGPGLFPQPFVDAVQVGEVSGQLAEVMAKQEAYYREDATRKLKTLTTLAGAAVYVAVGLMIIVVIVRIVMSIAGIYQDAMKGL